jgi:hypothetical protein
MSSELGSSVSSRESADREPLGGARSIAARDQSLLLSREVITMSTTSGTVSARAQSRCSSQARDTQPTGCAPA